MRPEPEHERDLDELRRLELHAADREPVRVAADLDAERRRDDEQLQEARRRARTGHAIRIQNALGHAARDEHERDADDREDGLLDGLHEEAAVLEVRLDRRRRQHHDEAEDATRNSVVPSSRK